MCTATADGLRWLYVDLNSFFASVEQQDRPGMAGRPLIVTPVESEYTSAIAVSVEAKRLGVRNGMSVREAREACPGIVVVAARHDLYVAYHHRMVAEVERHLPVRHVRSIDEVACRLIGTEQQPATARGLGLEIQRGLLQHLGPMIRSSIGIAPSQLLAKMASDMKKPLGLTIIEPHDLPDVLLPLPLEDIPGVGRRMSARIRAGGITRMRDLWDLSPNRARAIWHSIEGARVWYGLHGIDPDLPAPAPTQSIGHSIVLSRSTASIPAAKSASRQLVIRAASRLRRMERRAGALTLYARSASQPGATPECRFAPTSDTFQFLARLDGLWAMIPEGLAPLSKIGVLLHAIEGPTAQVDLFQPAEPILSRKDLLCHAVDRINRSYGRDTVSFGAPETGISRYTGAKIAFNRIPNAADFCG